jgi:hypothetical protein
MKVIRDKRQDPDHSHLRGEDAEHPDDQGPDQQLILFPHKVSPSKSQIPNRNVQMGLLQFLRCFMTLVRVPTGQDDLKTLQPVV